jgi:hypothetical protein
MTVTNPIDINDALTKAGVIKNWDPYYRLYNKYSIVKASNGNNYKGHIDAIPMGIDPAKIYYSYATAPTTYLDSAVTPPDKTKSYSYLIAWELKYEDGSISDWTAGEEVQKGWTRIFYFGSATCMMVSQVNRKCRPQIDLAEIGVDTVATPKQLFNNWILANQSNTIPWEPKMLVPSGIKMQYDGLAGESKSTRITNKTFDWEEQAAYGYYSTGATGVVYTLYIPGHNFLANKWLAYSSIEGAYVYADRTKPDRFETVGTIFHIIDKDTILILTAGSSPDPGLSQDPGWDNDVGTILYLDTDGDYTTTRPNDATIRVLGSVIDVGYFSVNQYSNDNTAIVPWRPKEIVKPGISKLVTFGTVQVTMYHNSMVDRETGATFDLAELQYWKLLTQENTGTWAPDMLVCKGLRLTTNSQLSIESKENRVTGKVSGTEELTHFINLAQTGKRISITLHYPAHGITDFSKWYCNTPTGIVLADASIPEQRDAVIGHVYNAPGPDDITLDVIGDTWFPTRTLIPGATYYLTGKGEMTAVRPSGTVRVLGTAITDKTFYVKPITEEKSFTYINDAAITFDFNKVNTWLGDEVNHTAGNPLNTFSVGLKTKITNDYFGDVGGVSFNGTYSGDKVNGTLFIVYTDFDHSGYQLARDLVAGTWSKWRFVAEDSWAIVGPADAETDGFVLINSGNYCVLQDNTKVKLVQRETAHSNNVIRLTALTDWSTITITAGDAGWAIVGNIPKMGTEEISLLAHPTEDNWYVFSTPLSKKADLGADGRVLPSQLPPMDLTSITSALDGKVDTWKKASLPDIANGVVNQWVDAYGLKDTRDNLVTNISVKADKTYVDTELAKKATTLVTDGIKQVVANLTVTVDDNLASTNLNIGKKADKTYVDSQDALKVNLSAKANQASVDGNHSDKWVDSSLLKINIDALGATKVNIVDKASAANIAIGADDRWVDAAGLKASVDAINTSIGLKADKTALATVKSDLDALNTASGNNITAINADLAKKADKTQTATDIAVETTRATAAEKVLTDAVVLKADITALDAAKLRITTLEATHEVIVADTQPALPTYSAIWAKPVIKNLPTKYNSFKFFVTALTANCNYTMKVTLYNADNTPIASNTAAGTNVVNITKSGTVLTADIKGGGTGLTTFDSTVTFSKDVAIEYMTVEWTAFTDNMGNPSATPANGFRVNLEETVGSKTLINSVLVSSTKYKAGPVQFNISDLSLQTAGYEEYSNITGKWVPALMDMKADLGADGKVLPSQLPPMDLTSINASLALKADKTYTDSQDALKVNISDKATATDVNSATANKWVDAAELNSRINAINAVVGAKADKSYVDTQDALKADKTYTDTELAKKADKTQVAADLLLKADAAAMTTALALKYDKAQATTDLALKADKTQVATDIAVESTRATTAETTLTTNLTAEVARATAAELLLIPKATTTTVGNVLMADGSKWTPSPLPSATASVTGIVQLADAAAITAGTANRIVDAAQLKAETTRATTAETDINTLIAKGRLIAKTAHGYTVGTPLGLDAAGAWFKCDNTSADNAEVIGIVAEVPDANSFRVKTEGYITGLPSDVLGVYFVSATAGTLTSTVPVSPAVHKPVLIRDTATTGYIIHRPTTVL